MSSAKYINQCVKHHCGLVDAMWNHGFGSTSTQTLDCCLTSLSYNQKQCWLNWLFVSRVGGLGNKGSCCLGRILSLSAFVTMCVTHQRQSGGTTSSNTFLMTCVRAGCPFIVLGQMWSGTRKMRLTNGMAGFQSLPFLTNQKIISVIFWLVHIIQSDSCISSQSNSIGAESCDLIGRKSSIFIGWWESILIG